MTVNFDFRIVQEKFPKSFELLKEWIAKEEIIYQDSIELLEGRIVCATGGTHEFWHFNPLELDFFFDQQGIYGTLDFQRRFQSAHTWGYWIHGLGEHHRYPEIPSRSEALQALWLKEFSILEEKLQ